MPLTTKDTLRLTSLIRDTDFIKDLKESRPALGGDTSEAKVNNASVAEGWEKCVAHIQSMVREPTELLGGAKYIKTGKLDSDGSR